MKRRAPPPSHARVVSFIVPAYDEDLLIARTLRAIARAGAARDEPFEIVVADDASTDGTAAIARAHGAHVVSVRNREIAATRNAGARAAQGDVRTLSAWTLLRFLVRLAWAGEAGLRRREGLDVWYAPRPRDPVVGAAVRLTRRRARARVARPWHRISATRAASSTTARTAPPRAPT